MTVFNGKMALFVFRLILADGSRFLSFLSEFAEKSRKILADPLKNRGVSKKNAVIFDFDPHFAIYLLPKSRNSKHFDLGFVTRTS
jgi:hypothetical protein